MSLSPTIQLPSKECIAKYATFSAPENAVKKYNSTYVPSYYAARKLRNYAKGLNAAGKVRKKIKQP